MKPKFEINFHIRLNDKIQNKYDNEELLNWTYEIKRIEEVYKKDKVVGFKYWCVPISEKAKVKPQYFDEYEIENHSSYIPIKPIIEKVKNDRRNML